jgi:CspA family cold shock protein
MSKGRRKRWGVMEATLTARPRPRLKPSKWTRHDNLGGTDQHGSGSHTLNPHINADAVTAGRVPSRAKKVDYVPTGKVKWYDKEKGFGFLAGEDGQEVFLPKSALPEGVTELKAGTRVEFGVADGRKGAQALGLRVLDKTPSIAKAKRPSPKDLAPLVQDLVSVLDNLSGTLSAGKYPEGNKAKAIAVALRKVADELDA